MNGSEVAVTPVRWGIIGAAAIALDKVIPAMQHGQWTEITAIASRDLTKARAAADRLGIARAYGSYEELLEDSAVEAVYNPLPNHLHVPWSIRAAEAGKHVLCEKPIGLTAAEARQLREVRDRTGVQIGEAFMVRVHPQWLTARQLVEGGRIGALRLVSGHFSYFKRDPANIRNRLDCGGGALMDVGCYPIHLSRFLFQEEPTAVVALLERDAELKIDRLTSVLMQFPSGQASFSCATQLVPYQRMHIFGTTGRIEVEIPFNALPDQPSRIMIDDGRDVLGKGIERMELPVVNQYTIQGDRFSEAIRRGAAVPVSLEDSIANMAVLDAIFHSARTGRWEIPEVARESASNARPATV
jgi:predicted dehydrogenase